MESIVDQLVEKFKEFEAARDFDRQALVQAHQISYHSLQRAESSFAYQQFGTVRDPSSEQRRPSVPLKGLRPILARNLQIDKHHRGTVLFGTLCADAHRFVAIATVLEDKLGDAVRLAIYDPSLPTRKTEDLRRLYPKGAKVAVKEPYFKLGAQDGVPMLRVDNPKNVHILNSFPANAETIIVEDLVELRSRGNALFRNEDWERAIAYYSKCIELALSPHKLMGQDIQKKAMEALVCCYSNRAEARLKLKEYHKAVEDCDKALDLHPLHLKSLFRKGRAFQALGEYKLACHNCFGKALQECPTEKEIALQYEECKKLDNQNQQGKFDVSAYFLRGCKSQDAPKVSNYIGPVLIKKSAGRGRGLFATDNVDVGDILLVDNAIAFSCTDTTRIKRPSHIIDILPTRVSTNSVKRDMVAKIVASAKSSPRILQQIKYLAEQETEVPPMDLFRINNVSWDNYGVACEGLEASEEKFVKIMHNGIYNVQSIETDSEMAKQREQYGLWALPSFINHSCLPNANCMMVGEAIFIIAGRRIGVGEEITVPYFDCLRPLALREHTCKLIGFICDCKRCVLERRLAQSEASPFDKIARIVDSLNSESATSYLAKLAVTLEKAMIDMTAEEKQLMRASFFGIYYNIFAIRHEHPSHATTLPSITQVLDAFQNAVPGNAISFKLIAQYVESEQTGKDSLVQQKALEACITFMGQQEEDVLKSVLKSAATGIFDPALTSFCCSEVSNLE